MTFDGEKWFRETTARTAPGQMQHRWCEASAAGAVAEAMAILSLSRDHDFYVCAGWMAMDLKEAWVGWPMIYDGAPDAEPLHLEPAQPDQQRYMSFGEATRLRRRVTEHFYAEHVRAESGKWYSTAFVVPRRPCYRCGAPALACKHGDEILSIGDRRFVMKRVRRLECSSCGDSAISGSDLELMEMLIARWLAATGGVRQPADLRFLRKAWGIPLTDLATLMKRSPEELQLWEKERLPEPEVIVEYVDAAAGKKFGPDGLATLASYRKSVGQTSVGLHRTPDLSPVVEL